MSAQSQAQTLIESFQSRRPIRATSLLMTVYGDSVEPHGGCIWLGSLINLLAPLGINQRLVRTSIFRLSRDNWLTAQRLGRRSFYRLTDSGQRQVTDASARIYAPRVDEWDGNWQIVMLTAQHLTNAQRDAIRRELRWQGFGQISTDVFAHPMAPMSRVRNMLQEKSLEDSAVLMQGRTYDDGASSEKAIAELVRSCCNLGAIETHYEAFNTRFTPLARSLERHKKLPDPQTCFLVRTLLVDAYRRILLQDPQLPAALLPQNWSGDRARDITIRIYHAVSEQAENHIQMIGETTEGPFGKLDKNFHKRFK
ncbi:MAG: phenylacetic acid degradation operon negative regulatory protein PaaX [Pseudomonadota bacterium]